MGSEYGSEVVTLLQADLESLLRSPDGKPPNFSESLALQAFSLHCRLSIHLEHKVCGIPPSVGSSYQGDFLTDPSLCGCVAQFCCEGKVHLSVLKDTGLWLESKVLALIQDQEEEYLKLHRVVYQQIIQVSTMGCRSLVLFSFRVYFTP